jgi:hypothetical protein
MSLSYVSPEYLAPHHGEQRLKEWVAERAVERGVSVATIYRMMASGKLKPEITRRLNARVVFVRKAPVNNL